LQVTVGDVAAQAGVKPSDAEAALQALAADTRGTLEVIFALCTHPPNTGPASASSRDMISEAV